MAVGGSGGSARLAYFPEEGNPVPAGFELTPTAPWATRSSEPQTAAGSCSAASLWRAEP